VEITSSGKAVNEDAGRSANEIESKDGKVPRISAATDMNYDLSIYSESELRQMYQKGEITKREYDEELSHRKLI